MRIKQGTSVFTADDRQIGKVDRVVIDPKTKEATHLVVHKGLFFAEDKVVPISLVGAATEARVTLREDAGDLEALPHFEESHFVIADERDLPNAPEGQRAVPAPLYWYGSAGLVYPGGLEPVYPPYLEEVQRNIPEGTVALKEGAKVVSADDKHMGQVEEVLTDPEADRVTHFVISKGLLLKERKLVPMMWVSDLAENEVHLAISSQVLEALRPYLAQTTKVPA
jgi:uncharacterized protein YrrD